MVLQFSFKGRGPCEAWYAELPGINARHKNKVSIVSMMADETEKDTVDAFNEEKMTWKVTLYPNYSVRRYATHRCPSRLCVSNAYVEW